MAEPSSPLFSTTSSIRDDDPLVERRTLRDYCIILRERLWIALPLALLGSLALFYFQARKTPMYQSTATMQFEKPETVVTSQAVVDPSVRSDIELNTNLQILNSTKLRTQVINSFTPEEIQLLQRPFLKELPVGAPPPPVAAALGTLKADSIRNSLLIAITVRHPDPQAAALVANRYVAEFMNYQIARMSGANETAVEFLKTRAEQLRKDSEQAEGRLQTYMTRHNLVSLDKSKDIVGERLKTISSTLTTAQLARLNLENQANQVEAFEKQHRDLLEIQYISQHGSVPALKSQLAGLLQTKAMLSERYLERHPKMIDVDNNIAVVREQLQKAIDLAIADLRTRLHEARQTEKSLQAEFESAQQDSLKLGDLSVEFQSLQNQAQVTKSNYLQILDRLNQTTTTRNIEKIPLHPLDAAVPAAQPYSPDLPALTRTCVGLGLLIFFGVAIGLSFVDDRIKSAWDVESFIGANLLGIVPDLSAIKDEEKYSLLLDHQQAPGVEAFLSVYSSVKIHSKLDFPKSILVTSTIPGEGKTLVSCNLAGAFARHGKKTLLVDCDLRRPMLHRHFKQQNHAGLVRWFENGAPLDDTLATTPTLGIVEVGENLSLLCSGGRSKTPTELLENPAFGELLEKLKREYELVIVDSPPLGAVTDSLLIAERTDEVIYVCRFNRAQRKHIRVYMKTLRAGKNEVLGVVLNGLSPRRIEYYSNYRYYRSYKKYYSSPS
jgi:capsular exopolysaccharide synthesis family protein